MNAEGFSDGLPAQMPESSRLYLAAPAESVLTRVREILDRECSSIGELVPGVLVVPLRATTLCRLCVALRRDLTAPELASVRCRLAPALVEPSLAELMQSHSLARLVAWVSGQWLADVIQSQRLVTYFQPIVRTCDPDRIFAYECLLRGCEPDGRLIPPDRLFSAARDTGMLSTLDHTARLTAIESFCRSEGSGSSCAFINMNPSAINEPMRCLQSTLRAAVTSGMAPDRFVFEVVESDEINDVDGLIRILNYCREAGCRVALDDLGAGYSSLKLLAQIKPDFIKLDMDLIRDVDRDVYKSRVASKLLEMARELGVQTIAEGVETEGEWQWSVEHGADFAQGYYFSRPAPSPPKSEWQTIESRRVTDQICHG